MIKLVAFDWNGTMLADTRPSWEGGNRVLEACGAPPITLTRYRETFAIPIRKFMTANGCTLHYLVKHRNRLSGIYHAYYERHAARARTRSGVRAALAWLRRRHIETIVFSNYLKPAIENQLARLGIAKYVDAVFAHLTLHATGHVEHKEQSLLRHMKVKCYRPSEVLVVGDTVEEIEIARKLGAPSVAITGGFCSTARLKSAKPCYLIHDMRELTRIVAHLNVA